MPQTIEDTMAGLADEGVPIAAIARALKTPSADVREVLHDAAAAGKIFAVPKEDWPPSSRRDEREPALITNLPDGEKFIMDCVRTFRVTRLQARLLSVLIRRPEATKQMLHQVVEQSRDPTKESTDMKIVDVVICHLRKRLKPFALDIETIWSCGYCMSADTRRRAVQMLQPEPVVFTSVQPARLGVVG